MLLSPIATPWSLIASRVFCSLQILIAIGLTTQYTSGASLSGIVKGSDGSLVEGGAVKATLMLTPNLRKLGTITMSTTITQSGGFSFPSLPIGTYRLCAFAPRTVWLGSCEWGGTGASTLVLPTPSIGGSPPILIVLKKGGIFKARVNDPGHNLDDEGRIRGAHVLIGVESDGRFFTPALLASKDLFGRTYQVTIPLDRSVRMSVASALFVLSDASGRALPQHGYTTEILVPSAESVPATPTVLTVVRRLN